MCCDNCYKVTYRSTTISHIDAIPNGLFLQPGHNFSSSHGLPQHRSYISSFRVYSICFIAKIVNNSFHPGKNGRKFGRRYFQSHFLERNVWISIKISLKSVPKGPIENKPELVQVMAWHRTGGMPLPEPLFTQSIDAYIWHYGEMT